MWAAGALHVGWMTSAQLQAACAPIAYALRGHGTFTTCYREYTHCSRAFVCAFVSRDPCLGSMPRAEPLLRCAHTAHSAVHTAQALHARTAGGARASGT